MDKIRTLIVDDSLVFRSFMRKCLAQMSGVEVVGEALNGEDALQKATSLKPDVMMLDMNMPKMNGLDVLNVLTKSHPNVRAIVVSSETDSERTLEALASGAFDFVVKPKSDDDDPMLKLRTMLRPRISQAARAARAVRKPVKERPFIGVHARKDKADTATKQVVVRPSSLRPSIVAIGSSTGGPVALDKVLSAIPANFPLPVVVVQHLPKLFLSSLAARFDADMLLSACLLEEGMTLKAGTIYIAPGESHVDIESNGLSLVARLNDSPKVHHCKPAVDVTFRSLAKLGGRVRTLAVVLTGMGEDGAAGALEISNQKGYVIAQDQETSSVWGMPGATVKCGAADEVLPLKDIAGAILELSMVCKVGEKIHAAT
ncbi:MAG: chemotaxis-specific protein-glutamate methyltransferase CheB [Mariprofundaceae bacterium]